MVDEAALESVPDDLVLVEGLRGVLGERGVRELAILERVPNPYSSTFASELVTVRCDGREETVFCKHGGDRPDDGTGHRRGVPYEAAVYRFLDGTRAPLPRSAGSFETPVGSTLVLEWLRDGKRLAHTTAAMAVRAAAAAGAWHAGGADDRHTSLNRYDAAHLDRWLDRAGATLGSGAFGGAVELAHLRHVVDRLREAVPTAIHGELFPSNVLVADGDVRFVDWETAGLGPGEIDLAMLTVGRWPDGTRHAAVQAYAAARWPEGEPDGFATTLAAARLYALVFIARHPEPRGESAKPWVLEQASAAAKALKDAA